MSERRFDDEEVTRILGEAAEASVRETTGERRPAASTGLTLAQLQEIGQQAGIPPERIAAAARAVDRPAPPAAPRLLGLTVGVADVAQLDRRIDDAEWERLVVLLRETFEARGKVQVTGNLRQWTNGNLQVLVEPGARGDRVRLRTTHGNARTLLVLGASLASTAAALSVVAMLLPGSAVAPMLGSITPLGVGGVASLVAAAVRLRSWAPERREQMRALVERLEAGPLD